MEDLPEVNGDSKEYIEEDADEGGRSVWTSWRPRCGDEPGGKWPRASSGNRDLIVQLGARFEFLETTLNPRHRNTGAVMSSYSNRVF